MSGRGVIGLNEFTKLTVKRVDLLSPLRRLKGPDGGCSLGWGSYTSETPDAKTDCLRVRLRSRRTPRPSGAPSCSSRGTPLSLGSGYPLVLRPLERRRGGSTTQGSSVSGVLWLTELDVSPNKGFGTKGPKF